MAGDQSASFDGQDDVNASFIKIQEHGGEKLSEVIAGTLESLNALPASSRKRCCIYKVSDHIGKSNELEACTPQVISIGPIHRNNPELQKMQSFKLRYLKNFNRRAETKLEDIVNTIKGSEESVRECYSETIPLGSSDEFLEMILVDASFIIEYFWKNKTKGNWTEYDWEILEPRLCNRMQMDLILLENQLPFFIIEKIYETAFPSDSKKHPFSELSFCQFEYYNVQNFRHFESENILHFTDLVRNFCMPPPERRPQRCYRNMRKMYSAAQLDCMPPASKRRPEGSSELTMHSATQLAKVGLKFKMSKSTNCSPLELKYANGVLEIPRFQLDENTQIYARNLIAFEQRHYREDAYITDYYFLLRSLIISPEDINFLVQKKIVKLVDFSDYTEAISVLKKILENIDGSGMNNSYSQLAEELNEFYTSRRTYPRRMIAILKREYFYNPWRGLATIGAILLLLLTVTQTVCALISVKNWE